MVKEESYIGCSHVLSNDLRFCCCIFYCPPFTFIYFLFGAFRNSVIGSTHLFVVTDIKIIKDYGSLHFMSTLYLFIRITTPSKSLSYMCSLVNFIIPFLSVLRVRCLLFVRSFSHYRVWTYIWERTRSVQSEGTGGVCRWLGLTGAEVSIPTLGGDTQKCLRSRIVSWSTEPQTVSTVSGWFYRYIMEFPGLLMTSFY